MKKINTINGTINFGRGEFNFKEIINDIPEAKSVFISTYNFSNYPENSELLSMLKGIVADIVIVTNIPKRFENGYKNDKVKSDAKKMIENYLRVLDPKSFVGSAKIYFNFLNHSKIYIVDNRVAYIGSANYSEPSCHNYEIGNIYNDEKTIDLINENIVKDICDSSIRIAGGELDDLKKVGAILNKYRKIINRELGEIEGWNDDLDNSLKYNPHEYEFNAYNYREGMISLFKNIVKAVDEMERDIRNYRTLIKKYDLQFIDDMDELFNRLSEWRADENLDRILEYDKDDSINNFYSENSAGAAGHKEVESILARACEYADEVLDELIERAEDIVFPLISNLPNGVDNFIEHINKMADIDMLVDDLLKNLECVDNTNKNYVKR